MAERDPSPTLVPIEDTDTLDAVVEAITKVDYDEFFEKSLGDDVRDLSSNTVFDSLDVASGAVFKNPAGGFEASGIAYVTLNYGGSRDSVSMPDSYPAVIKGEFDENGIPVVTEIHVDTSSFYE
jgi:hypothetical protein